MTQQKWNGKRWKSKKIDGEEREIGKSKRY